MDSSTSATYFAHTSSRLQQRVERVSKILMVIMVFCLPLSTTLADLLFVAAGVTALLAGNIKRKLQLILSNPVTLAFLVFFGVYLLGACYSVASSDHIFNLLNKQSKFLFAVCYLPLLTEQRWRHAAIMAFLASVSLLMLLSYAKYAGHFNYGVYYDSTVIFKSYLESSFVMINALYLLALGFRRYRALRWPLVIGMVLLSYCVLFMSFSRIGYLLYFMLVTLFCLQQIKWRGLWMALALLLVLAGLMFGFSHQFQDRFAKARNNVVNYVQHSDVTTSIGKRIAFIKTSVASFVQHPLLGTGTGSVTQQTAKLAQGHATYLATDNPHNEYLNTAVQLGILGLLALAYLAYACLKAVNAIKDRLLKYYGQALLLIMAVGCITNSWLMDTMEGHFFVFFMVLLAAHSFTQQQTNGSIGSQSE